MRDAHREIVTSSPTTAGHAPMRRGVIAVLLLALCSCGGGDGADDAASPMIDAGLALEDDGGSDAGRDDGSDGGADAGRIEADGSAPEVTLARAIPHQVARLGEPFSFAVPEGTFAGAPSTLDARVLRRDPTGEVPAVLNDFFWQRELSHHWLSFDGVTFSGTPSTYDDLQTLSIEVIARGAGGSEASTAFLLVVVDGPGELAAPASTEAECAHVLGDGDSGNVDGAALGIEPGDSICVRGGETTGALSFLNLEGTAARPIYIVNVGGQARTRGVGHSYTVKVTESNHFRILGAGTPDQPYGWAISGDTGPGIQIKQCYRDIEVAGVEIHDTGFAGLSIKNDGEQRPEGDMFDVRAHDLYVHDAGTNGMMDPHQSGESVYCGIGSWDSGTHSIHRLRMHHIIGRDVAWDAIQIKNNDDGDSVIERNFIRRYGLGSADNTGVHDEGLFAGEGSSGVFRYNWIEDAFGPSSHGIQFFGAASTLFHHNVIVNLADGSRGAFPIYGARKGTVEPASAQRVRFVHNTFAGFSGGDQGAAVRIFSDFGTQEIANNLFADIDGTDVNVTDAGGNILDAGRADFHDVAARDLRPSPGSPARGAGQADPDVERDILGHPIPADGITSGAFQAP